MKILQNFLGKIFQHRRFLITNTSKVKRQIKSVIRSQKWVMSYRFGKKYMENFFGKRPFIMIRPLMEKRKKYMEKFFGKGLL